MVCTQISVHVYKRVHMAMYKVCTYLFLMYTKVNTIRQMKIKLQLIKHRLIYKSLLSRVLHLIFSIKKGYVFDEF